MFPSPAEVEFEVKLQVPAERLAAVRAALDRGRTTVERLRASYYDTPDGALAAQGIVLRLRKEGRRWVQTAKAAGAHPLQRLEHNVAVSARSPVLDPARHGGTPVGDRLLAAVADAGGAGKLGIVYSTDITRRRRLAAAGRAKVELALDTGTIRSGDRATEVCELELELKQGDPSAAVALAARWCERYGLWVDTTSKAERGSRLARGESCGEPATARTPDLPLDAAGPTVLGTVLTACLRHVLPNASDVAAGVGGEEHIHQLRIGLRRLRTALRELGELAAPPDPAWEAAATAAFRDLGRGRDRAVVAPALQSRMAAAGGPALAWEGPSDGSADAAAVVRQPAFQQALLGYLAFAQACPAAEPPGDTLPARQQIRARLRRLQRKVKREGRRFRKLEPEAQHRLRKNFKRLRYLAELVKALYPARKVDRFVDALKPVQDALGHYQDERIAEILWHERTPSEPQAWFGVGWLAARRDVSARACEQACKDFAQRGRPFWSES